MGKGACSLWCWVPWQDGAWVPGQDGAWVPWQDGAWVPGQGGAWVPRQDRAQAPGRALSALLSDSLPAHQQPKVAGLLEAVT